ncbi:MAG: PEGA domain-containing protein [Sandaracinaceae bacterium]|nr:PEGA domain-containing protein [Sandaracinaceae bacterium]
MVQAAEARPDLVARSRAAVQAAITGPRGRFEVRADAEGARVFLDDRPLGALPRVVEATVGPHVVRVDAPGHASFAQLVEVLEGDRAPIAVELAPTSELAAAERALAAAREGRARAVADALGALAAPVSVWLVWAGAGARDRAVAVALRARGLRPAPAARAGRRGRAARRRAGRGGPRTGAGLDGRGEPRGRHARALVGALVRLGRRRSDPRRGDRRRGGAGAATGPGPARRHRGAQLVSALGRGAALR